MLKFLTALECKKADLKIDSYGIRDTSLEGKIVAIFASGQRPIS